MNSLQVSSITHFGFAELLRGLPELRKLGRCDCFGEVRADGDGDDDGDGDGDGDGDAPWTPTNSPLHAS